MFLYVSTAVLFHLKSIPCEECPCSWRRYKNQGFKHNPKPIQATHWGVLTCRTQHVPGPLVKPRGGGGGGEVEGGALQPLVW